MKSVEHQIQSSQQSDPEERRQPGASRIRDVPSQKTPIFIHSLFRAGSTYLFQVFRRCPEAFWCYQEPLHELVFFQRDNVHGLEQDHSDTKIRLLRHPRLEKSYFSELIQVWPAWKDAIDEEMIYGAYFDGAHTRMDFWRVLSGAAQTRPVFQECRTAGRIGALKIGLGGYHIYLWRNPWDQWWSLKVASYFDVAIQMMIRGGSAPAAVAHLLSHLKLPTYSGKDLGGAFSYYAQRPLNSSHSYLIFYLLWCLALREGQESANLMLNIDRLSDSPSYRLEILKKMEDVSIRGIHFDDCAIPQSFYSEKEKAFFGPLEEQVHGWLLAGGWSQKALDQLLEQRRRFQPECWVTHMNRSDSGQFAEQTDRARELAKRLESELAAHANHEADLQLALSLSENRITQLETNVKAKELEAEAARLVREEFEAVRVEVAKTAEQSAQSRQAFLATLGGLGLELGQVRKEGEAVAKSVGGLKDELAQQRKAQQEEVEESVGEMKREIVAEIHSLIKNLVEQGEKNRLEVSARIDSMKEGMEGRINEVGEYAAKIREAVVSPSSYLIPAPFSWYSYLHKMLNIREPVWLNKEKRTTEAPKRPGFWRRLERSIRKRRKRLFGGIGFDREWYLQEYLKVGSSGIDPLDHYLRFGIEEGRWKSRRHKEKALSSGLLRKNRPGFLRRLEISIRKRRKRWTNYWTFDPDWYLEANPDVRAAGIDPLQHYISFGKKEGRRKRAPETGSAMVIWQALTRACGYMPQAKANCSLIEIEGPWWILEAKIGRPDNCWGACGLRIRVGGREVYLERPGTVAEGIVSFRHLLKLPLGECTIRMDWIEEGMPMQKILYKECHVKGVSVIDQEKILSHPVDGQTDMTVMPKYGFWRGLEKKIRNRKKAISAKFNKKFKPVSSERVKPLLTSSESNRKSLGRRLFVDITSIVDSDRLTGIERVTQSVLTGLFASQTQGMEIIPVHSVENQHGFFVAKPTIIRKGRWERGPSGEVAVQPLAGDIFLGLVLNPHGICENANLLAQWADEGVSILFYVYDLLPIQYPQFWPLEAQTDILHHEWLSIVTSFDEVVCISKTTARRCREFLKGKYPPRFRYKSRLNKAPVRLLSQKAKISSIHLGSDFDAELLSRGLPEDAEKLLAKFRAKGTSLMVGTLEPRKGHRQILEVFEELWRQGEDAQLVIVGRNGWLMEDFAERLEKHPEKGKKLFWLTEVSDEFLAKIYQSCSCLLAASIDEGFGLPIVEAIQHDKPVLARDIEVFRETGGLNVGYFKDNKDEIVDCILKTSQKKGPNYECLKTLNKWENHVRQLEGKVKSYAKPQKAGASVPLPLITASRPKILQITNYSIENPDHGGKLRCYNIRQALRKCFNVETLSVEVADIDSVNDWSVSICAKDLYEKIGDGCLQDWASAYYLIDKHAMWSSVRETVCNYNPEGILLEQPFLFPIFKKLQEDGALRKNCILINSTQNNEVELKRGVYEQLLDKNEADKKLEIVSKLQSEATRAADVTIAVSKQDLDYFKTISSRSPILLYGNGHSGIKSTHAINKWINKFSHAERNYVLVGSWHMPNILGLKRLLDAGLLAFKPEKTKLWVFGGMGPGLMSTFSLSIGENSPLQIIGQATADDIDSAIMASSGVILPLWDGGGSNLKTAQALLSGKTIISTSFAFRGLEKFCNESGVNIRDDASELLKAMQTVEIREIHKRPEVIADLRWDNLLKNLPRDIYKCMGYGNDRHALVGVLYFDCTTLTRWKGNPTGIERVISNLGSAMLTAYPEMKFTIFCRESGKFHFYNINQNQEGEVVSFHPNDIIFSAGANWDDEGFEDAVKNAKHRGAKCSLLFYDVIPCILPHSFGPGFSDKFTTWVGKSIQLSDSNFAISNNTRKDLIEFASKKSISIAPTTVVRLGDTIQVIHQPDHQSHEKFKPIRGEFILSVGTLEYRKNHIVLLNAYRLLLQSGVAKLPKLIIVGGQGWMDSDISFQIQHDKDINKYIEVLSGISDAQLADLYKNCLFTVYPALYEGWGLPVSESLGYGKICITSRSSSMVEIAPHLTPFANPLNPEEWAEQISRLINNRDLLAKESEKIHLEYKLTKWAHTASTVLEALERFSRTCHQKK